jgi:two-component system phosphate regulon response regulator PhoB
MACGQPVQLRALELRLLRFLLKHPDRVFTREQLLIRIWGVDHSSDSRVVDATIQRARKTLLQHGCGEYLQAVRGVGYRLSLPGI